MAGGSARSLVVHLHRLDLALAERPPEHRAGGAHQLAGAGEPAGPEVAPHVDRAQAGGGDVAAGQDVVGVAVAVRVNRLDVDHAAGDGGAVGGAGVAARAAHGGALARRIAAGGPRLRLRGRIVATATAGDEGDGEDEERGPEHRRILPPGGAIPRRAGPERSDAPGGEAGDGERRGVDRVRAPVEDHLADHPPGRRGVEDPPRGVPRREEGAGRAGHGPDQRQPVHRQRPVAGGAPDLRGVAQRGGDHAGDPAELRAGRLARDDLLRIVGQRGVIGVAAHVDGAARARVDLDRAALPVAGDELVEDGLGRHVGAEDDAGALGAEHLGQRHPALRLGGPRPERQHDGVGRVVDPVDRDAVDRPAGPGERHAVDDPGRELGPPLGRRLDERPRELAGVDLRGRLGVADDLVGDDVAVEPLRAREAPIRLQVPLVGGGGHERVHPPIAEPLRAQLLGELAVQREARPRELVEGRPRVPVEGEEARGLPRRRRGRLGAVHDEGPGAAPGEEVGDRRPDDAGPADDDAAG